MNQTELHNHLLNLPYKTANQKRRYHALAQLVRLIEVRGIKVKNVRSTKNQTINGGDLVETLVKHLIDSYKGHNYIRPKSTSPKGKRDCSLFYKELEVKTQLTADSKASYSPHNNSKRFIGVYFNSSYYFEIKTFSHDEAVRCLDTRGKAINLKNVVSHELDDDFNGFKTFVSDMLNCEYTDGGDNE